MKKIYTLSLLLILSVAISTSVKAQVVYTNNFDAPSFVTTGTYGTPAIAYAFVLTLSGTVITVSPGIVTNSLVSGTNYVATISNGNSTTAGGSYFWTPLSGYAAPFSLTPNLNTSLVTWTFNMQTNTAVTSNFVASGSMAGGIDLWGNGASNIATGAPIGYGVEFNSGPAGGVNFLSLTNGLSAGTVLIPQVSIYPPTDYYSVKVTYDPSSNTWSLYTRDDGPTGFADPSTGTLTLQGQVVNTTSTSVAKVDAGVAYSWPAGTANSKVMSFDNFTVSICSGAGAITGTTTTCLGVPQTLSDLTASQGGTWVSSNTAVATVNAATGVYTGVSAGTAVITYNVPTACAGVVFPTATVNITPSPATVSGYTTVCLTGTTNLTPSLAGGTWTSSSTTQATVTTSGLVTGLGAGGPVITYTLPTGCITPVPVTVFAGAPPAPVTGSPTVCTFASANLASATSGGTWTSSNNALASIAPASGVVTGIAAGTPTITYTTPGGCIATSPLAVKSGPSAILGNLSACAGDTTRLGDGIPAGVWSSGATGVATISSSGLVTSVSLGTSTISYTLTATGCAATASVSVSALPALFTLTQGGGSSYCAGTPSPIAIGLSGSNPGVNYQLFDSTAMAGASMPGTGSPLSFGFESGRGAYTISATNAATGCASLMTGTGSITINPSPAAYTVSGGHTFCAGSVTGSHILLSNSDTGISYRFSNGASLISTLSGTGSSLDFGLITAAGNYSVVGVNNVTGCSTTSGSAVIVVNPLPAVYAVTGGGAYCANTPGVHVGLASSTTGINYSLYRGGIFRDSTAGTGGAIDLGLHATAGTYTIIADNPATGCTSNMADSVVISIKSVPTRYSITGGGGFCVGGTGVPIGVSGSETSSFYQVYNGPTLVGTALTGSGAAFNLGTAYTTPGTYIVEATGITSGCKDTMTGNATVITNSLPVVYNVSGGGSYCAGGTGVPVLLSNADHGIRYQLYYGAVPLADSITGEGSAISFNNITTAGTYRIVATDTASRCTSNMAGNAVVSINSLPGVYMVTGGGSYCIGSAGVNVGLSSSNTGINYELYGDGTFIDSVSGANTAINFGLQTGTGTYTVIAVNAANRCSRTMPGTVTVTGTLPPTAHNVTGGGDYCAGTAGRHIGLDQADAGTSYQLYNNGFTVGSAVAGISGSPVDFGVFTAAGDYTVTGTVSGCNTVMTDTAVITIDPAPHVFTVSGGGSYCFDSTGADVMLGGSDTGINYQLYDAGSVVPGGLIAGTGASLDFGLQRGAGLYTVVAKDFSTGCTSNMAGAPTINIIPPPPAHNMTGGGSYCSGGSGKLIGLDGSDAGMHYQLNLNGSPLAGSSLTGTGIALNFGSFTSQGNYTVTATNLVTGCTALMAGIASVNISVLPVLENVIGGGTYCINTGGVDVSLNPSDIGYSYQLFLNGTATGVPAIIGSGSTIDFGSQTAAGNYTVVATNPLTGCSDVMLGNAVVAISAPTVFTVLSGSATYCQGQASGTHITLSGSAPGVNYQLYNSGIATGLATAGTGLGLDLGLPTGAGHYTVVATNTTSGCSIAMADSAVVTVNGLPGLHTVTGGGAYCATGAGVPVGLDGSDAGISYQLYNGSAATGTAVAGTNAAIGFGLITPAGSYKVVAVNTATACTDTMTDLAVVTVKPIPFAYNVTVQGNGNYCSAEAGDSVGLSGSGIGISYQLYKGGVLQATIPGTGSSLGFGPQTAGTYTVIGSDPSVSCNNNMAGSAVVTAVPSPVAHTVNGGGSYCPGTAGRDVLLDGSDAGMYYQLYNSGIAVGSPVIGTGIVLDFGYRMAGSYTVIGTDNVTVGSNNITCVNKMLDTVVVSQETLLLPVVTIQAFPAGVQVSHIDSIKAVVTNGGTNPTYQWVINGNIVPGATQATYSAIQLYNGDSVACMVTASGPCGGLTASNYVILSLRNVGVTQVTSAGSDIKLVPNPNKGIFTLKGTLGSVSDEEVTMEVANMLGQVVYSNKVMAYGGNIDQRIDLGNTLANGMYIMTLRSGTRNSVIHFVVEQ